MLKGKKLSIIGDSVSTYQNISNDPCANSTIFYNPCYYGDWFPEEKTYWKIVADTFGLELCVNNSWSGGNLSGRDDPNAGVNRVEHLSRDDGTDPDVIIIFMGINDLGRRVPPSVFSDDYLRTLQIIKNKHPNASVCCINLPDRAPEIKAETEIFNDKIFNASEKMGKNFFVADLFSSRLNNDFYYMNTIDGLHPDEDGMKIIAEVVTEAFRRHFQ